MTTPRLSVIVPAFQGAGLLPRTLAALRRSDLPADAWELIVVDDGSRDATSQVAAEFAARVVTLPAPPRGPAGARNAGAAVARGAWLVFVDADVEVHADTLRAVADATRGPDDLVAVFGTYDADPPAPGLVSQFRNLFHRYTHQQGAGEAGTFWAGCGAVRADAFHASGGFDAARYPRPQIEDIELGYRLRARGGRIRIDPRIQAAHLKQWTFWGGARTDLWDRAVPWVRLLLERGGLAADANLNLKSGERAKTGLVGLALALLPLTWWLGPVIPALAGLLLLVVVAMNHQVLTWFARMRGWAFAVGAAGLLLWYHFLSGVAVLVGGLGHLTRGPRRRVADPAPGLAPGE